MKIKRLNHLTVTNRCTKAPKLRVNSYGVIVINAAAAEIIGVKVGDGIELVQDEERPNDWYIIGSKKSESLKLKDYKNSNGLVHQSGVIAKRFLKEVSRGAISVGLLIGTESITHNGETLWPIITSSLKQ
jgi:hypothetical protein